jgi:putative heme-binding domain-containing protein
MDQLTVGARFYDNEKEPMTRGFLAGEIAEVLIYDRLLDAGERADVDRYLQTKYGHLFRLSVPPEWIGSRSVVRVPNPPPVQMLTPGFAVRKLPVDLTNINNVRYRADGKLVVLAYDGRIYLLSDTDGDGLEDHAEAFWDRPGIASPIGICLTPAGYSRGQGVFVACKGQVVLVVDTDGDDRADERVVVASGWTEINNSVDALGLALGPDGSVYFGLGTEDYTNAYLLDEQQKARYEPRQERSSILKISPDFKHREQVCSGVRFPVGLAFNRLGDLFCTDQEGATWLPNGNPFDELLHIQPGRHYGFPPRHPRHLPGVIDEPSVYDYSPQHQSTCGLCFNEPAAGNKVFGPEWWLGDALVCGYSRGKLFRTTLVKTPRGYVADNTVLACLDALTIDACLSPRGELIVATHSGGPDWGSGPAGKGKLYQVSYVDRDCPQPVRAWASSPHEVRIAFDRPLDPRACQELSKHAIIEGGPYVRAGDRFESFAPGYAAVERQSRAARKRLPVLAANLTADRRSIILATGPHTQAVHYAAILQAPQSSSTRPEPSGALPQWPVIELTYDLSGVEATWRPTTGDGGWSTWWPHLDAAAAAGLLAGSAESDVWAAAQARPGKLTLRTQLDLWQMLRPAVQPRSKVDAELPREEVTVTLESVGPFVVKQPTASVASSTTTAGRQQVRFSTSAQEGQWCPIEVVVSTGGAEPVLDVSWHTADDSRPRAFAQRRFLLPWARPSAGALAAESAPAELAGGDWRRGKDEFFSERAQCGKCHSMRGKGGWIGPDLSNLVHRDYASVLRDVTYPSFAINPDHLAYTLVVDDGRTLTGMVQPRGDALAVGDIKGLETIVPRGAVEEMVPTLLSIMPEGLPKAIGDDGMRDLLTFLLTPEPGALEPAPITIAGAPESRTRAEVDAVLKGAQAIDAGKLRPLEILLVAGPKDHGANEHDYPQWQQRWTKLLGLAPRVRVATANPWPTPEQWRTADVAAFFSANPGWNPARAKELDAFLERGGGLVYLHFAVNGHRAPDELARRIGLAWDDSQARYRHGALDLQFRADVKHPITAGFTAARFVDESYWNLIGDPARVNVLATQVEEGRPWPLLWTFEPGRGRVFCSILGHYSWTFDDPLFRVLLLRGLAWTAGEPVDRFNELVTPGSRIELSAGPR